MPEDGQKLNLKRDEIECGEEKCRKLALTTYESCWEHLPEEEKTGLKDRIVRLARERQGDLEQFILVDANLRGIDLKQVNLAGANLRRANLQGVNLWKANLRGANMEEGNLQGIFLVQADIEEARIERANLKAADLRQANLRGAALNGSNLQEAIFLGADLQEASLYNTNLREADLSGANLEGAYLLGVNLQRAHLFAIEYDRDTNLVGADTRDVDWSKNPSLERFIKDQQYIDDFKRRAQKNRKLKVLGSLWWLTCDYGRSFWRWLAWSLGISMFFGFLYAGYELSKYFSFWPLLRNFFESMERISPIISITGTAPDSWWTPYYYSIITFSSIGFGDVVPLNLSAEILVTIEVLLRYFMLAGLISIFINTLARRY